MGQRRAAMGGLRTAADGPSDRPVLVMMAAGAARRFGGCKPLAPVGLHGEAVIDLNAGDALRAGFGDVVLVLGPATGPAIAYHVRRTWPAAVHVAVVEQTHPLGTVHAVITARNEVGDRPFAVVNADDIYGVDALRSLADHLATGSGHVLVAYRLGDTVVSPDPVTRGTVETDGAGGLRAIVERRMVTRHEDGAFTAEDSREPKELSADTPVSMNLWGFSPGIWPVLDDALRRVHPALRPDGSVPAGREPASDTEVLLPEVVGNLAAGAGDGSDHGVRVLMGSGRCVGVTHADDVALVRVELAEMVGQGLRAESAFGSGA